MCDEEIRNVEKTFRLLNPQKLKRSIVYKVIIKDSVKLIPDIDN